jgi:hypothetical protein
MAKLVIPLNGVANWAGEHLLAPIALLPGWLSATLVAMATGVAMLLVFKYTSNQRSIRRVRDGIKADLLALSLFKDNLAVTVRCQGRVLVGAFRLLLLAFVPLVVMTLPMGLLLAQLALWYQARPLRVGEEAVLTVLLADKAMEMPEARLEPTTAAETTIGPVRVPAKHMICWNLLAAKDGCHCLTLSIAGRRIAKELAVGDGFMRVSLRRSDPSWWEALLHPGETPLPPESLVRSVTIDYPQREAWTSGSGSWLVYWFVVSMSAAFCARPVLKVNV